MTKAFSKILAVILSLCVLFAIPVCAAAEDEYFQINGSRFKAVTADWNNDYVGQVKLTLSGGIQNVNTDGLLIEVSVSESVIRLINAADVNVSINNGTAELTFNLDKHLNHASEYIFTIPEGAFVSADGKLNSEYAASITGNELLETYDVQDVPVTPVEKIIAWLEGIEANDTWQKVINFVINILNWFINI